MKIIRNSISLAIPICLLLGACVQTSAKKADVLDMYELPRAGAGQPMIDNDSYYVQPTGYKGCAQIGDAPSCGGG